MVDLDDDWEAVSPPPSDTCVPVLPDDGAGALVDGTPELTGEAEIVASSKVQDGAPLSDPILPTSWGATVSHEDMEDQLDAAQQTDDCLSISPRSTSVFDKLSAGLDTEQGLERSDKQSAACQTSSPLPMSLSLPETPLNPEAAIESSAAKSPCPFKHSSLPPQEHRFRMHTKDAANLSGSLGHCAPFIDLDGSPVFVGSALIDGAVHPCKITLSRLGEAGITPVRVPLGGRELVHHGVYEILSIDDETMEWVRARNGRLPFGRTPVEGGYNNSSRRLYYAATTIEGCTVPGKTWENDVGANFPWEGKEIVMRDNYDVLCWRPQYYSPHRILNPRSATAAPFTNKDGTKLVYVVSAPLGRTRQPGRATFYGDNRVRVRLPYDKKEVDVDWASAEQPVEILDIDLDIMEWVATSHGRLPIGMQPIDGGYDKHDQRLYHATYVFDGRTIPGKTGEHLHGARFPWDGKEQKVDCGYKILCWKRKPELKSAHTWLVPPPPVLIAKRDMRSEDVVGNGNIVSIGIARHDDGSYHPGSVSQGTPDFRIYPHGGRAVMDFSDSYDILKFEDDAMEWVCQVKEGKVPAERRPVEAGYEKDGRKLFFARHCPSTPYIYGKTGEHMKSGHFVQDGKELILHAGYDILCWRDG